VYLNGLKDDDGGEEVDDHGQNPLVRFCITEFKAISKYGQRTAQDTNQGYYPSDKQTE